MKTNRTQVLAVIREEIKQRFLELGSDWNVLPDEAFSELEKVARGKKMLVIRRGPGVCDCCKKLRVTAATYSRTKKSLHELYGL